MRTRTKSSSRVVRSFIVVNVFFAAMIAFAGSSSAAPTSGQPTSSPAADTGLSTATIIWLMAGLALAVVGMLAASTAVKPASGSMAASRQPASSGSDQDHGRTALAV
jgi:hypothetical protein